MKKSELRQLIREELSKINEVRFYDILKDITAMMKSLGFTGGNYIQMFDGYDYNKDINNGVLSIGMTALDGDDHMMTYDAMFYPKIDKNMLFGLIKRKKVDFKNGKRMSNGVEHIDLGHHLFDISKSDAIVMLKSKVKNAISDAS